MTDLVKINEWPKIPPNNGTSLRKGCRFPHSLSDGHKHNERSKGPRRSR